MKQVKDILQLTSQFLKQKGFTASRRVSEQILSHVLGIDRLQVYMQHDRPMQENEIASAREILKKVVAGYPIEYICGYVDFLDCRIEVDQRVLIPRPETEIMAHTAIQYAKGLGKENITVLDLCSGSGALGLAFKKHCKEASVTLVDISNDAIEVAKKNAVINALDVKFLLSDLTVNIDSVFDIVLCNPPYISTEAYNSLDSSVRDNEPRIALCAGDRGTEMYERLAIELPRILQRGAKIFLEIGYDQAQSIQKIFENSAFEVLIKKDWAGLDRFVEIEYLTLETKV